MEAWLTVGALSSLRSLRGAKYLTRRGLQLLTLGLLFSLSSVLALAEDKEYSEPAKATPSIAIVKPKDSIRIRVRAAKKLTPYLDQIKKVKPELLEPISVPKSVGVELLAEMKRLKLYVELSDVLRGAAVYNVRAPRALSSPVVEPYSQSQLKTPTDSLRWLTRRDERVVKKIGSMAHMCQFDQ